MATTATTKKVNENNIFRQATWMTSNETSVKEEAKKKQSSQRSVFCLSQASIHWRANSVGLSLSTHLQNHFICHRKSLIWDCFMLCTRSKMLSTRVVDSFDYFTPPHFTIPIFWVFFLSGLFSFHRDNYFVRSQVKGRKIKFCVSFSISFSFSWFNFCDPVDDCVTLKFISLYSSFCVVKRFAIAHK